MPDALVRPNHKAVKEYYRALDAYAAQDVDHELAVRSAFQNLLDEAGRKVGWTLIPELSVPSRKQKHKLVTPDGTFRDEYRFINGHWEAKDTRDNLDADDLPRFAEPQDQRRRRRRNAGAAPVDRTADPPHLRRRQLHAAQRHRPRGRTGDRRAGQPGVQLAQFS